MLVLGLSVIDRQGSIALLRQSELKPVLVDELFLDDTESLTLTLAENVVRFLERNRYAIKDVSLVGFSHGPGSFTGLRIGLSVLKGLLFGCDVPVVPLSSLACYGFSFPLQEGAMIAPLFDARKGEVYFGLYQLRKGEFFSLHEDCACSPAWCAEYLRREYPSAFVAGGGREKYREVFSSFSSTDKPSASPAFSAGMLAWQRFQKGEGVKRVQEVHLNYCRASEAERTLGEVVFAPGGGA